MRAWATGLRSSAACSIPGNSTIIDKQRPAGQQPLILVRGIGAPK